MRKLLFFALFLTTFFACTDKESTLRNRVAALEKEFSGADFPDEKKAGEYIASAEELAGLVKEKNPNECADLLLKAAGLAKTIDNPQKSIELYSKLADGMPEHKKAPTAFFMLAYVYANDLKDLDKARAAYEVFLQKFPNDELAESARTELKNLGKSEEEILEEIKKNNPDSIESK